MTQPPPASCARRRLHTRRAGKRPATKAKNRSGQARSSDVTYGAADSRMRASSSRGGIRLASKASDIARSIARSSTEPTLVSARSAHDAYGMVGADGASAAGAAIASARACIARPDQRAHELVRADEKLGREDQPDGERRAEQRTRCDRGAHRLTGADEVREPPLPHAHTAPARFQRLVHRLGHR